MSVVHNTSRPESVLRKKTIQFDIMPSVSQLQWVSLVDIFPAKKILQA